MSLYDHAPMYQRTSMNIPFWLAIVMMLGGVGADVCRAQVVQPPSSQQAQALRVFIFAGQSNMEGGHSRKQDISRYPPFAGLEQPQDKVLYSFNIGREEKRESNGWVALRPVENIFGPELSFAHVVSESIEAPIAIIKCAAGGTHLGGDWNPDHPAGFKLYPLCLQLVRDSLAALDQQGIAYRLEGFMWHQGENDMFDKAFKPQYEVNLKRFIECWRRDLNSPELPFYIGELCTKTIWGMDNRMNMYAIRQAQKSIVASVPRVTYVATNHDAVEIGNESGLHYHYGTLGQLEHGVNYAHAYLKGLELRTQEERPLSQWPFEKGSRVQLFVLVGHRNMEGERAFVQELQASDDWKDLVSDHQEIPFRYSLGGGYKVSAGWEPLGPAGFYDTFGPELSFGATLRSGGLKQVAIAKFTHSGSQINDWTPEGTAAIDCNLYQKFLAFLRESMADIESQGNPVELAGIFYHLGENDMAFGPYRREAAKWLQSTVVKSREDLGIPSLRWIVSQQLPPEEPGLQAFDITADLQRLAQSDPAFVHLPVFELGPREEKLVLSTKGIVLLGEKLARCYLEIHK